MNRKTIPRRKWRATDPDGWFAAMAARQMQLDKLATRRLPRMLEVKRRKMLVSPHGFFRGSAPLFYEILAARPDLVPDLAGSGAIVGDMHLENMGAYRRNDGAVTFDLNDFDEGLPEAPLALDVIRVATSTLLSARYLRATGPMLLELAGRLLVSHARALFSRGRVHDPPLPEVIATLLHRLERRTRQELLAQRTAGSVDRRHFVLDGKRYLPLPATLRRAFPPLLRAYAARLEEKGQNSLGELHAEDVALRIAGTGSLGKVRIAAIVAHGKRERILDFKEAGLPAELPLLPDPGLDQAERIVGVASRLLPSLPRRMGAVRSASLELSFVGQQLTPQQDKLDLSTLVPGERTDRLLETLGHIVGRAHARGLHSLPARAWSDRKLREVLARAAELAAIYEGIHLAYALGYGGISLGGRAARQM